MYSLTKIKKSILTYKVMHCFKLMQCLFYDLQCKYKQISASHDIHSFRSKGGFYIQASRFHKLAQVNAILKLIL